MTTILTTKRSRTEDILASLDQVIREAQVSRKNRLVQWADELADHAAPAHTGFFIEDNMPQTLQTLRASCAFHADCYAAADEDEDGAWFIPRLDAGWNPHLVAARGDVTTTRFTIFRPRPPMASYWFQFVKDHGLLTWDRRFINGSTVENMLVFPDLYGDVEMVLPMTAGELMPGGSK